MNLLLLVRILGSLAAWQADKLIRIAHWSVDYQLDMEPSIISPETKALVRAERERRRRRGEW